MNVVYAVKQFRRAQRRLLLLDYDGTLAAFNPDPAGATPTDRLRTVLARLTADPANTVVIISGRPAATLQAWLGDLPVGFSAEHGFMLRRPGGVWEAVHSTDQSWKQPVRKLMQAYTDLLAGAILEEKTNALAWHWRAAANQMRAAQLHEELADKLEQVEGTFDLSVLEILRGNKVIEVHPSGFSKGTAALQWLRADSYDFVLAAGDDTTDEDMFEALPSGALTIKIGDGASAAHLRLASPAAMIEMLEECI